MSHRHTMPLLFFLALALRLAVCGLQTGFASPTSDVWLRARHVVEGHGPVAAIRGADKADPSNFNVIWYYSPIYRRPLPWLTLLPFALLPGRLHFAVYLFTCALSALVAVVAAAVAKEATRPSEPATEQQHRFSERAGLISGLFCAVFPYQVFNAYMPYDTTFVSFGVLVLFYCLLRWRRAGATSESDSRRSWGWSWFVLGAASCAWLLLSRFTTTMVVGLSGLWVLGMVPGALRRKVMVCAMFGLLTLIPCLPWVWYVHANSSRWSMGPGLGKGLYWAYNRHTLEHYPWHSIDVGVLKAWRDLPIDYRRQVASGALRDFEANEPLRRRAVAFILAHPLDVVARIPVKLLSPWLPVSPWYATPTGIRTDHDPQALMRQRAIRVRERFVHGLSSYAVLVLAVIGYFWLRRRPQVAWLLILPWVAMFATAAIMWAHSRGRAIYDPLLMTAAGIGAAWICERVFTRHAHPQSSQ